MIDDDSSIKKKRNFIRAIPLFPFFFFIILFWKHIWETIGFFFRFLLNVVGFPINVFTPDTLYSLIIVGFNVFFGFFFLFLIWLALTSRQALLPVSSIRETIQTAIQLIFFIFNLHGPAVFVKDGKLKADAEELHRRGAGVAVVDFNSAIVLEQFNWAPKYIATILGVLLDVIEWFLAVLGIRRPPRDPVRVCGPGLIFIKSDERLQGVGDLTQEFGPVDALTGVVDLRPQFTLSRKQRSFGNEMIRTSVRAYTRDGIELTTNVWTLFAIGLEPDKAPHVLHIICDGGQQPENLRVVTLKEDVDAIRIREKDDELDPEDSREICSYIQSNPELCQYRPLEEGGREPVFDTQRVFSAVYGRARLRADEEQVLPWMKLPVRVATDYFREILSHYNFDELYRPDTSGTLLVDKLRGELRIKMRNASLLNYRLVYHRQLGWPLLGNDDGVLYNPRALLVSPVRALQSSKILRERGIQMLASGFGDLLPTDEVYLQWLASWRAEWERDTKAARAASELDAKRIYNRARVQAQRELAVSLQGIFEDTRHSKEALAMRILQALETVAADRETQRLLPSDTMSMLRSIHDWLLPGDRWMGRGNPMVQERENE